MFNRKLEKRILFVGIPDMAYICLDGLKNVGVNIVGVVGPKKDHPTYASFKNFVQYKNIDFIEYDNLEEPEFIEKIKKLNVDLAVVCSFNYKIPKVLLDSVKDGFINVHPSLLPHYRGPNPYTSVILNGERETGVTLHFMDETFDTGDIIYQKSIVISDMETMGTIFNRTNILALEMLTTVLKKYESKKLDVQKQPEGTFVKAKNLLDEELLINYNSSAYKINSLIRGLNPFILARTNFRGTITKVLSADVFAENGFASKAVPGEIVAIENDRFYVKTMEGLLSPTSLQFGSFFAGTSKEFIRILNPRTGERFS